MPSSNGRANGSPAPAGPGAGRGGDGRMLDVAAAEVRRAPGAPGQWSRFLAAHVMQIVLVTLAVMAGAGLLAWLQTPKYTSQAAVAVYPSAALAGGTNQTPDMGTEQGIASSGTVLAIASRSLKVPETTLKTGLSVTAPVNTYLLDISFTDPNPQVAQRLAQGVAEAYVAFRTPAQHTGPRGHTSVSQPLGGAQAAIVTPASLPTSPTSPKKILDIGAALILGLALGVGIALIRDRMDDSLRGASDLERQAGTPVLATIPASPADENDPPDRLAVVRSPDSVVAEAYWHLRTRFLWAAERLGGRTLLVTSPAREETATVAANLAATLALSGRRVSLVCADLGSSRAQEPFHVANHIGLTSVLEGGARLAGAIQHTDVPALRVLPTGPVLADLAVAPQLPALRDILDLLQRQADFVIIEAPPVLAGPNAGVLAELADMILLVADEQQSTRTGIRASVQELSRTRATLIGCVLDKVRSPRRPRGTSPVPDDIGSPRRPPGSIPGLETAADEASDGSPVPEDAS